MSSLRGNRQVLNELLNLYENTLLNDVVPF